MSREVESVLKEYNQQKADELRAENYARYLDELIAAPSEITYSFTEDQLIDFCTKIATQLVKQGILFMHYNSLSKYVENQVKNSKKVQRSWK